MEVEETKLPSQESFEVDVSGKCSQQGGCVNHEFVGLSSNYWSYIHLAIRDVQRLELVQGIDCLTSAPTLSNGTLYQTSNNENNESMQLNIPVSRCEVNGIVVGIDIKSDGRAMYLVDDGTDLIDCIEWTSSYNALPEIEGDLITKSIQLGDVVRVLGKIRTIACNAGNGGVREIHVDLIQSYSDALPNNETLHWLKCIHTGKQVVNELDAKVIFQNTSRMGLTPNSTYYKRIKNGNEIAYKLDIDLKKKSSMDLDDDWEYFGAECSCELSYKKELLYCHCHAKYIKSDPEFFFRDFVLRRLLKIERDLHDEGPLFFLFKSILNDSDVKKVGEEILGRGKNLFLLLATTFDALRSDGVIYLNDTETDEYLLVSSSRVLEPFVKESLVSYLTKENPPKYIQHVPRRRITFIRNKIKRMPLS